MVTITATKKRNRRRQVSLISLSCCLIHHGGGHQSGGGGGYAVNAFQMHRAAHRSHLSRGTSRVTPFQLETRQKRQVVVPKKYGRSIQPYKALTYPVHSGAASNNNTDDPKNHLQPSLPFEKTNVGGSGLSMNDKVGVTGLITIMGTFLYALLSMAVTPGSWRYFLAGGICAATSHAIPTPIDVVKTRKQVDASLHHESLVKTLRHISKTEGPGALWAGLGPTIWGYLLEGALKFGVYEILKPVVRPFLGRLAAVTQTAWLQSQLIVFGLCGIASGLTASLLLCPMEAIRIRIVSEPELAQGSWVDAGIKIARQEGIMGLYKGLSPMMIKQVPYTVTKNVSFDVITKTLYSFLLVQGRALSAGVTFMVPFASAALASVLSSISSQPGDMVLSLVNAQDESQSPREYFANILRTGGIRGFFVGFRTRLLHVGATVTLQLLIYDYVKRLCGIAATGM